MMFSTLRQVFLATLGFSRFDTPDVFQQPSRAVSIPFANHTIFVKLHITPYANGTTVTVTETIDLPPNSALDKRAESEATSVPSNGTIIVAESIFDYSQISPIQVAPKTSQQEVKPSAAPMTTPASPATSPAPAPPPPSTPQPVNVPTSEVPQASSANIEKPSDLPSQPALLPSPAPPSTPEPVKTPTSEVQQPSKGNTEISSDLPPKSTPSPPSAPVNTPEPSKTPTSEIQQPSKANTENSSDQPSRPTPSPPSAPSAPSAPSNTPDVGIVTSDNVRQSSRAEPLNTSGSPPKSDTPRSSGFVSLDVPAQTPAFSSNIEAKASSGSGAPSKSVDQLNSLTYGVLSSPKSDSSPKNTLSGGTSQTRAQLPSVVWQTVTAKLKSDTIATTVSSAKNTQIGSTPPHPTPSTTESRGNSASPSGIPKTTLSVRTITPLAVSSRTLTTKSSTRLEQSSATISSRNAGNVIWCGIGGCESSTAPVPSSTVAPASEANRNHQSFSIHILWINLIIFSAVWIL